MILLYLICWNLIIWRRVQTPLQHPKQVQDLSIYEKMSPSEISKDGHIDTLNINDILKEVYRYFNEALKEERKHFNDCLRAESDHTKTIVTKIFQNLSERIGAINEVIEKYDVTLADLDLRIETTSAYHQEHLHSLKMGLQDVLQTVEKDMQSAMSDLKKMQSAAPIFCQYCGEAFQTEDHLRFHVDNQHALASDQHCQNFFTPSLHIEPMHLQCCNLCSLAVSTSEELMKHMVTCHGEHQLSDPQNSFHTRADLLGAQGSNIYNTELHQVPQICNICGMLFGASDALENHMRSHETYSVNPGVHSLCDICGVTCNNKAELDFHRTALHRSLTCHLCDDCGKTFQKSWDLRAHIQEDHIAVTDCFHIPLSAQLSISSTSLSPIPQCDNFVLNHTHDESQEISPIPQFDGADSVYEVTPSRPAITEPSSVSSLHMPYKLNQQKQVANLTRDSMIADFHVSTNDSDRNVCIQCSVGFYEAVVKPTFTSISSGFSQHVMGVQIHCTVYRTAQDRSSNIPGLFLRFELSGPDISPSPAPLSIHLHNTQRKIQLQGGSSMPDKSATPVWFVKNVLKPMFVSQAQTQGVQIQQINELVATLGPRELDLGHGHSQTHCHHCKKKFSSKARPVLCSKCFKMKHSTRCSPCTFVETVSDSPITTPTAGIIPTTTSPCTTAASTMSSRVSQSTANASRPVTSSISFVPHQPCTGQPQLRVSPTPLRQDIPTVPTTENYEGQAPTTVVTHPVPSTAGSPRQGNQYQDNTNNADQVTSQVISTPSLSIIHGQSLPTEQVKTRNRQTRKAVKAPAIDKDAFETECLKKQLNIAHTKIQELETELEKTKNTNFILGERVKLFEASTNSDLFEKYFPKNLSSNERQSGSSHTCYPTMHQHHCCAPPPPPCISHQCYAVPPDLTKLVMDLSAKVTQLSQDITAIRHKMRTPVPPCSNHPVANNETPANEQQSVPLSPDIIVLNTSAESLSLGEEVNMSVVSDSNTIDDNVPNDLPTPSLNFSALTTQPIQSLGLIQDISQP